jgi:hypothetical protein
MQQVSVQLFLYSTALMIILCDEGTAKGDPTEANWVGKHFSRNRELIVGSVKGNIGCGPRFFPALMRLDTPSQAHRNCGFCCFAFKSAFYIQASRHPPECQLLHSQSCNRMGQISAASSYSTYTSSMLARQGSLDLDVEFWDRRCKCACYSRRSTRENGNFVSNLRWPRFVDS